MTGTLALSLRRDKFSFEQSVFLAEAEGFVAQLKAVPFGYAFLAGGPGSGKTTLGIKAAKAIISDVADASAAVAEDTDL